MTVPPPDGSRDRRIEDLSNLYLIHPAAAALLPRALAWRVSANAVSVAGLVLGVGAAACYASWSAPAFALFGLLLSAGWLIADGLDGMVARATGTASRLGRILDGVVDHGVFILIYCAIATSIGTASAWALAIAAGAAHAVQSMLYEGERARFHRRLKLLPPPPREARVPIYDDVARSLDAAARRFDVLLATAGDRHALALAYGERAVAPMRAMALESANVRVLAIFAACIAADPALFWWFELVPLSAVLLVTVLWHRSVEARLADDWEERGIAAGVRR